MLTSPPIALCRKGERKWGAHHQIVVARVFLGLLGQAARPPARPLALLLWYLGITYIDHFFSHAVRG